jgi:hypothetical protein
MRLVIDVAEPILQRVQELVKEGRFSDMNVFVATAIENQLSLESSPMAGSGLTALPQSHTSRSGSGPVKPDDPLLRALNGGAPGPTAPVSPTASLSTGEAGWIWGLLNRLLPLKVAARTAANMTRERSVSLNELRRDSSRAAARLGAWLAYIDKANSLSREDRLATAFPIRHPTDKSTARFADHFAGRLTSGGQLRGGLFELGLAGVVGQSSNDPEIALTQPGWLFARIPNPVLDQEAKERGLSQAEADVYLANAIHHVPREKDCLLTIVGALAAESRLAKELDEVIRKHFDGRVGEAEATTLRAGALGRLFDLGLLSQARTPQGARWDLSDRGREVSAQLEAKQEMKV